MSRKRDFAKDDAYSVDSPHPRSPVTSETSNTAASADITMDGTQASATDVGVLDSMIGTAPHQPNASDFDTINTESASHLRKMLLAKQAAKIYEVTHTEYVRLTCQAIAALERAKTNSNSPITPEDWLRGWVEYFIRELEEDEDDDGTDVASQKAADHEQKAKNIAAALEAKAPEDIKEGFRFIIRDSGSKFARATAKIKADLLLKGTTIEECSTVPSFETLLAQNSDLPAYPDLPEHSKKSREELWAVIQLVEAAQKLRATKDPRAEEFYREVRTFNEDLKVVWRKRDEENPPKLVKKVGMTPDGRGIWEDSNGCWLPQ